MNLRTSGGNRSAKGLLLVMICTALAVLGTAQSAVDEPEFSVAHGFFEAPFLLKLSSPTDGAVVRFTTDSSEPTLTNGQTYTRPLIINRTKVVRAAAFQVGEDPSVVVTQTYLFLNDVIRQTGEGFVADWGDLGTFGTDVGNRPPGPYFADYSMDPDVVDHPVYASTIVDDLKAIPSLSVVLDREDLFSSEVVATDPMTGEVTETRGIYPIGKGFERAASVELLQPDGSAGFQINGSVEVQGATSTDRWKTAKLSMRLKFKAPYGPSELDYPLFGDDASDNVNTVILDSTNQQSWTHPETSQQPRAQYVRDQFVGDLQNAMGGIAPHGRYAHLYLDGLYWGVYWMHEFVEEVFAVAYRGGKKSEFDIMRHRADNAIAGNGDDYNAMIAAASGDLSSAAALASIESYLDLAQFADYMLVNFYAGNGDWAFQNWNATRNRVDPDSRWLFHNWDAEKTFQFVTDDNTDVNDAGAPTFLHQQLLANDQYRLLFADRVHKHCFNGGVLTPAKVIDAYLWRTDMIERAIVGESARWGDNRNPNNAPYTRDTWLAERDRLINSYFPARTDVLLEQLRADGLYPTTTAPIFSQQGGEVASGFLLAMSHGNASGTLFYTVDGTDPRGAGALSYGGPISINTSQQVRARVLMEGVWSAVNEAVFVVDGGVSNLRVTEIHYHPGAVSAAEQVAGFDDEDAFEFIEIRNTGSTVVNLEGVNFAAGIDFTFGSQLVNPGGFVLVVNDRLAFEQRYGTGVVTIAGEFSGSLANSGEAVEFRGKFGELIQSFEFDDSWYPPTDGDGTSLVIVNDVGAEPNWSLVEGWRASTFIGGSPGAVDATPIPLRITEIHYRPAKTTATEEAGGFMSRDDFEFIEIRNVGGSAIELGGIQLSGGVSFTFPAGTLNPDAFILIVNNAAAFTARNGGGRRLAGEFASGSLSDSGERLILTGAAGELIHDFTYNDAWYPVTDGDGASLVIRDQSVAEHRWNEASAWRASTLLHGSPAAIDADEPPALRITEIMFHPGPATPAEEGAGFSEDDFDFIELTNTGDTALNLANFSISGGLSYSFANLMLGAGERVLLVEDEQAFEARYGSGLPVLGSWGGSLSNSSDQLILQHNGATVLDFSYEDTWYPSTDGGGFSLTIINERAHPLFWDNADGWRPSGAIGGTPGVVPDDCAAWLWENFDESELADPAIGGIMADPDSDGLSNLLEFALALDPKRPQAASNIDLVEVNGDYFLTITIQRDRRALLLNAEVSSDLATWSSALSDVEIYILEDQGNGIEEITYRDLRPIDFTTARRFMRVAIAK